MFGTVASFVAQNHVPHWRCGLLYYQDISRERERERERKERDICVFCRLLPGVT
jgi:hypothetical protein